MLHQICSSIWKHSVNNSWIANRFRTFNKYYSFSNFSFLFFKAINFIHFLIKLEENFNEIQLQNYQHWLPVDSIRNYGRILVKHSKFSIRYFSHTLPRFRYSNHFPRQMHFSPLRTIKLSRSKYFWSLKSKSKND